MSETKHSSSRAKSTMGSKKSGKKSGKKPHSMHIKRGKSGGFIVEHHHQADDGDMAPEPEDHVVPDLASLHDHLDQNMGDQEPAPAPSPDMSQTPPAGAGAGGPAAAPAPAPAPGPAAPGM
jgi:hypothetical protein